MIFIMDLIKKAVVRYKDKFNVSVRELSDREGIPIFEVSQDKTLDGQYFTSDELRDIVTSLFASVHDDFHIGAKPYVAVAHDTVDFSWLKKQLADHSIKVKVLAKTLGIDKKDLSNHLSGKVEMNNSELAMYYYYFKNLKSETSD